MIPLDPNDPPPETLSGVILVPVIVVMVFIFSIPPILKSWTAWDHFLYGVPEEGK